MWLYSYRAPKRMFGRNDGKRIQQESQNAILYEEMDWFDIEHPIKQRITLDRFDSTSTRLGLKPPHCFLDYFCYTLNVVQMVKDRGKDRRKN